MRRIPQTFGILSFSLQVRHWWGVPKVFNLEKKPRQSTDLEEYVFKVPNNFIELRVGAKLSKFENPGFVLFFTISVTFN